MVASAVKVANELPAECVVVAPGTGELGMIRRGEFGYHPMDTRRLVEHGETVVAARDRLNQSLGVSKVQAEAMLAGSICGWHVPAADPANYNEDGSLKR